MANDICFQVGQKVRTVRLARGWTQQILADHSELTREHISAMENGRTEPGLLALYRIARALEVNIRELLI